MATLGNFYENATKAFDMQITHDGSNPDITGDTVKMYIKESLNAAPLHTETADVVTQGADGIAEFTLSPTEMALDPGRYWVIFEWTTGDNKYVVHKQAIEIEEGVGATT